MLKDEEQKHLLSDPSVELESSSVVSSQLFERGTCAYSLMSFLRGFAPPDSCPKPSHPVLWLPFEGQLHRFPHAVSNVAMIAKASPLVSPSEKREREQNVKERQLSIYIPKNSLELICACACLIDALKIVQPTVPLSTESDHLIRSNLSLLLLGYTLSSHSGTTTSEPAMATRVARIHLPLYICTSCISLLRAWTKEDPLAALGRCSCTPSRTIAT